MHGVSAKSGNSGYLGKYHRIGLYLKEIRKRSGNWANARGNQGNINLFVQSIRVCRPFVAQVGFLS